MENGVVACLRDTLAKRWDYRRETFRSLALYMLACCGGNRSFPRVIIFAYAYMAKHVVFKSVK